MLKSGLGDHSDAYILVKGTISVANKKCIEVIFKSCAPLTDWITEINNTQIDNAKDTDVAMPTYNSVQYRNNYSKTLGSL